MSNFFKKLLQSLSKVSLIKNKITAVLTDEEQLVSKLMEMVHYENLNELFYNPVNKLYMFNAYSSDFNDLTGNLYNSQFRRQVIAINIHSYFLGSKVDIQSDIEKIAKCLKTHKTSISLQHDLYEIVTAFEYLKSLEK